MNVAGGIGKFVTDVTINHRNNSKLCTLFLNRLLKDNRRRALHSPQTLWNLFVCSQTTPNYSLKPAALTAKRRKQIST
jgi:hypothetical protein